METRTFKEAVNSTESLMWKEAIKHEIDSILHNHTWELLDLPSDCKPLSSKWVFKRKRKVNRSIDKYKERLVIKGYKQTEGLNHFDTNKQIAVANLPSTSSFIYPLLVKKASNLWKKSQTSNA